MKKYYKYPQLPVAIIKDEFWSSYIKNIRDIMLPYCFGKFEEEGYLENFLKVAAKNGEKHNGLAFYDGLLFEAITGASNFLNVCYDKNLDAKLDEYIDIILGAQEEDGYLSTIVSLDYPERKWGEGPEGDIVVQHDLYNQGALIEAAVAHYRATKKKKLLKAAVKCANNICSYMGEKPKHNVIPGHSLPEMAFIQLAMLFREARELDTFAAENCVNIEEYIEVVRFWYDNRGNHTERQLCKRFAPEYNQDNEPFGQMRKAVGHAVRAGLCYQGAAAARRVLNRDDYETALLAIWKDVITKKLHISGGIGACKDIEGFDAEYQLQNDAYLETCAGIALAFWAAEMNLISKNAEYFDVFELSLYNNILGAVGEDFKKFYYDNPLVNDGTKNRWDWHECPCCPPMLLKCYSSLATYIYSYSDDELCVNMYIGSDLKTESFLVEQSDKIFKININGGQKKVSFRIPAYAEEFCVCINGNKAEYSVENGYAVITLGTGESEIVVSFKNKLTEICANPKVADDIGRVCVMYGPFLMCAEGIDNNGKVDFVLSENTKLIPKDNRIKVQTADKSEAVLIPYYTRNNRVSDNPDDSKMAVWFEKENMKGEEYINGITGENLYGCYKIHK